MRGPDTRLRIGTRGSALAVWQTERVRALLGARGFDTERVEIKTTGDLAPNVPLARIGSRALFTKQIDDALLEGRIDLAVHSLKDLPTQLPAGLTIAAVSAREDPRDALVGQPGLRWKDIRPGAVIATSSLRRRAQILRSRPDLSVVDIRGNVDTRLAKLDARPEWAATVLAAAGLVRLGLGHRIGERLPPEIMLPAPGQGALAVTTRDGDGRVSSAVREAVHDEVSALEVAAERAFLRRLEGGCQVPVAALASKDVATGTLRLQGRVVALDGDKAVGGNEEGLASSVMDAEQIGTRLAERLLAEGGVAILNQVRSSSLPAITEP